MPADPTTVILCLGRIKPRKKYDAEWICKAIELIEHQGKTIAAQRKQLAALNAKDADAR